jgi:23S rRNA pseudouridine2605 synthase
VGRLDMSSGGLILVTNDGELANGLTHPRHGVEKIYHVQVAGHVDVDELQLLRRGVHLAEGFARVKLVRVKSRRHRSTILEMILDEGRNREIRRLLARIGHKVQRLTRVAVGPVRLGDMLPGTVRPLSRQEVAALHRAIAAGRRGGRPDEVNRTAPPRGSRTNSRRRAHRGQPR